MADGESNGPDLTVPIVMLLTLGSSNVFAIGYDAASLTFATWFAPSTQYRYGAVPFGVAQAGFDVAAQRGSVGRWHKTAIKDAGYAFAKVPPLKTPPAKERR